MKAEGSWTVINSPAKKAEEGEEEEEEEDFNNGGRKERKEEGRFYFPQNPTPPGGYNSNPIPFYSEHKQVLGSASAGLQLTR